MIAIQFTLARRVTIACFASIATIASYFYTMTRGIAAGALIGLPSRVTDVIMLQGQARNGLYAAVLLQVLAVVAISPLVPPEPSDDNRVLRSVCRLCLAALLSVSATVLLGTIAFSLIVFLSHPVR
jgi:hypothetical protein